MPTWEPLLRKLILELRKDAASRQDLLDYAEACIENGLLPRAASIIRQSCRPGFIPEQLASLFDADLLFSNLQQSDPRKVEMRARLDVLLSLPWAGIVTTNYDILILDEVSAAARRWRNICLTPYENLGRTLKSSVRPFLIHLHGNVRSGPVILTEGDYDSVYFGSSPLQSFLQALLLRYTVVFICTQVEDRFVEMRRQLQRLFKDTDAGTAPRLHPEYVVLPFTDKRKGDYLESTGGFIPLYYENETGSHEGFVPRLKRLRGDLTREETGTQKLDPVSDRLVKIIQANPEGLSSAEIAKKFVATGELEDYPDLNLRELFYRLYFLIYKKIVRRNEEQNTFVPY